jgi:hypothetical protein
MNETKFKILMHNGIYVNCRMLDKGIYNTDKPDLYSKHETIDTLIERYEKVGYGTGIGLLAFPKSYIKNLSKCELVEVELNCL